MTDDFETQWRRYRRAEIRLPRAPRPEPGHVPLRVDGLRALLDRGLYDAVVLDAWGVLNLGDAPIPAARAAFGALRASGLPLRVLSNDAGSDAPQSAARHARRGFDVRPAEIIYGLDLLGPTLEALAIPPSACALIAPRPAPRAELTEVMCDLAAPGAEAADALVLLSSVGYDEATHARLRALLRARPRPLLVCNPDIVSPEPVGCAIEPGYYAHALADELGIAPEFLGKPFPGVYERLLADLPGVRPERVLCVGDTLHTDVLGGAAAGMHTLLVESGFFRGQSLEARCAEAGILPTWLAAHL
jgi:HAD superfamily hydrolase (TIGR01450 family)